MAMQQQHAVHAGGHHDDHAHGAHDDHDVGPHSSMREYVIGFLLSVALTAIPFWLVMADVITHRSVAVMVLGGFAIVQVLVHMVFFLHMNGKIEGGWTMLSTIFTVVFLGIAIAGTLWVMFHMNANMMPMHGAEPGMDHRVQEGVEPGVQRGTQEGVQGAGHGAGHRP